MCTAQKLSDAEGGRAVAEVHRDIQAGAPCEGDNIALVLWEPVSSFCPFITPPPANLNGLKGPCWGLFKWFYAYKFSKFLGHTESCGKDVTFETLGMPMVISSVVIPVWWTVPSGTFTFFKHKSECVDGRGTGTSPLQWWHTSTPAFSVRKLCSWFAVLL